MTFVTHTIGASWLRMVLLIIYAADSNKFVGTVCSFVADDLAVLEYDGAILRWLLPIACCLSVVCLL